MTKQRFIDLLGLSVYMTDEKQAEYLINNGVRYEDTLFPSIDTGVLNRAIDTYGTTAQTDKAIEEMSELTKALLKERYARKTEHHIEAIANVCEELADAVIMLNQLVIIFTERYNAIPGEEYQNMIDFKIERLKGRL